MSVAEMSKLLQNHIIKKVSRASKVKRVTSGLDIEKMRKPLASASRHIAVLSQSGLENLSKQFNGVTIKNSEDKVYIAYSVGSTGKFKTYDELGAKDKEIVSGAIQKFSKFVSSGYDEFLQYLQEVSDNRVGQDKFTILSKTSEDTGKDIVYLKNIPQSRLLELTVDWIHRKYQLTSLERVFLLNNLDAGHTAGVFSLKMLNTFGLLTSRGQFNLSKRSKQVILPEEKIDSSIAFMTGVINMLTDIDRISSNMPDELSVFNESVKNLGTTHPTASTELQLAWRNKQSGNLFTGLGVRIANLSKVASSTSEYVKKTKQPEAVKSFIEGIQKLALLLKDHYNQLQLDGSELSNIDEYVLKYISTPSSPIIIDDIINVVYNTLIGKPNKSTRVRTVAKGSIRVPTNNLTQHTSKIKQDIKGLQGKIKQLGKKPQRTLNEAKVSRKMSLPTQASILPALQVLLDSSLTERIKQNMKKPTLQNRTGRFAESVKVERLSESRAGMITAFYRYMRSPYQTFEPGFKQGSNARNPKSLISKSIRDIASTMVGNRLRAVSI